MLNRVRRMANQTEKPIETVSQLVKALGGTKAVAKWADVGPPAVSNWKMENYIPPGWHLRLFLECGNRKLKVAPTLFGLSDKPKKAKARPRKAALNGQRVAAVS